MTRNIFIFNSLVSKGLGYVSDNEKINSTCTCRNSSRCLDIFCIYYVYITYILLSIYYIRYILVRFVFSHSSEMCIYFMVDDHSSHDFYLHRELNLLSNKDQKLETTDLTTENNRVILADYYYDLTAVTSTIVTSPHYDVDVGTRRHGLLNRLNVF